MNAQIVLLSANGVVLKVSDISVRIGVFAFLTCQWHFLSLVLDFSKVGQTNVWKCWKSNYRLLSILALTIKVEKKTLWPGFLTVTIDDCFICSFVFYFMFALFSKWCKSVTVRGVGHERVQDGGVLAKLTLHLVNSYLNYARCIVYQFLVSINYNKNQRWHI